MKKIVKFRQWDCYIVIGYYANGRIAIRLLDAQDNEPVAVISVNLPDKAMNDNEVFIKNYSENEGILECMIHYGIVSEPIRFVQSGFVIIPLCMFLVDPNTIINNIIHEP